MLGRFQRAPNPQLFHATEPNPQLFHTTEPLKTSLTNVGRSSLVWTLAAPTALLGTVPDGSISRIDGALLLLWFVVVLVGLVRSNRNAIAVEQRPPGRHPLLRLVGGLALLSVGGEILGRGIRDVVSTLGVSEALLGNTVVAASVAAEEAVRVAVPSREARGDIDFGNVAGTIVHFSLFNAGAIALVKPLECDPVSVGLHAPAAVVSTLLLCGLIAGTGAVGRRSGALLLSLYACYVAAAIVVGFG
jgi:cation:H+ antiporter